MYLDEHNSYNRNNLQDWLNLFIFIWNRNNKAKVIFDLLKLMITTKKEKTYREYMCKNATSKSKYDILPC